LAVNNDILIDRIVIFDNFRGKLRIMLEPMERGLWKEENMSRFLIVAALLGLGGVVGFLIYPLLNKKKDEQL